MNRYTATGLVVEAALQDEPSTVVVVRLLVRFRVYGRDRMREMFGMIT